MKGHDVTLVELNGNFWIIDASSGTVTLTRDYFYGKGKGYNNPKIWSESKWKSLKKIPGT